MKSGNIYYIVIYKKETCKLQIYNITVHSFYKTHYSPQYFCSFHISFNTMQAVVVVVWTLIQDIDAGIFFNFISINRKKKTTTSRKNCIFWLLFNTGHDTRL